MSVSIRKQRNEVVVDENVLLPTVGGLRLACKLWSVKGKSIKDHHIKCICYPGWLDNSGSFDIPAEIFVREYGWCVLAVDPVGCGLSDHRPPSCIYVDFDEVPHVANIADELGWQSFGLIGHSRGGGVCALAAGLLGSRVRFFVSIDSHYQLSGLWADDMKMDRPKAVKKMKRAMEMQAKNLNRTPRVFATFEEALDANKNHQWFKKSEATARNIVKRHVRPCAHGYTFTHDVRTYGQIAYVHLSQEALEDFLVSITAPTMQLIDEARSDRIFYQRDDVRRKIMDYNKLLRGGVTYVDMRGKGHHFHSDHGQEFCDIVGPWAVQQWNKNPSKSDQTSDAAGLDARPQSRL